MLQPLAISVIGGILISMVLSLIITPAVHFCLSRQPVESELVVRPWDVLFGSRGRCAEFFTQ
jgi:hypothetical protein